MWVSYQPCACITRAATHPVHPQSPTMTALQILRAALNALADPAGGLGKGMAMTPATSDALRTQLTPSASSLFALLSHPAMHASTSAHPRPPSQKAAAHHPGHASQLLDAALSGLPAPSTAPPLQLFRKHHPAVLIDPTGFCNLAAHMTKSSAALVGYCKGTLPHTQLVLPVLSSPGCNCCICKFMFKLSAAVDALNVLEYLPFAPGCTPTHRSSHVPRPPCWCLSPRWTLRPHSGPPSSHPPHHWSHTLTTHGLWGCEQAQLCSR
jgi:hypothetical protein